MCIKLNFSCTNLRARFTHILLIQGSYKKIDGINMNKYLEKGGQQKNRQKKPGKNFIIQWEGKRRIIRKQDELSEKTEKSLCPKFTNRYTPPYIRVKLRFRARLG